MYNVRIIFSTLYRANFTPRYKAQKRIAAILSVLFCKKRTLFCIFTPLRSGGSECDERRKCIFPVQYSGKIRSTFVQHRSRVIKMMYGLYFFFIISCDGPPAPVRANTRDRPFRESLSKSRGCVLFYRVFLLRFVKLQFHASNSRGHNSHRYNII